MSVLPRQRKKIFKKSVDSIFLISITRWLKLGFPQWIPHNKYILVCLNAIPYSVLANFISDPCYYSCLINHREFSLVSWVTQLAAGQAVQCQINQTMLMKAVLNHSWEMVENKTFILTIVLYPLFSIFITSMQFFFKFILVCPGVKLITSWKPTVFCLRNQLETDIWVFGLLVRWESTSKRN